MQKIYFEKWIDLNHQLNELLSLSVDESINYKIESVGVRAVGSLIVKGEYNGNQNFDENIELDVLATFDKIVDQRDFNIKVEDFDYFIKEGNIQIKIEVGIHGVVEGEDRYVRDEHPDHDEALEEIENLIRDVEPVEQVVRAKPVTNPKQGEENSQSNVEVPVSQNKVDKITAAPAPKEVQPIVKESAKAPLGANAEIKEPAPMSYMSKEPALYEAKESTAHVAKEAVAADVSKIETAMADEISEQLQEKVYQSKSRPIFQDTSDSVGTYYLYIIKENDSYSEVATRYSVDEEIIRNYNQDKALEAGGVLIIPYVP